MKYKSKKNVDIKWMFHYYTLFHLSKNSVSHINSHIKKLVSIILSTYENDIEIKNIIESNVDKLNGVEN